MPKTIQKQLAIFLSLLCILSTFGGMSVSAAESGSFSYTVLEDGTAQITGYSGTGAVLEIPSEIDGYTVTRIQSVNASSLTAKTIVIPASIIAVGESSLPAFYGCMTVESFVVSEENPAFCALDGVLYNKAQTKIVSYPKGRAQKSYAVPQGVTVIGEGAFWFAEALTSLTLPDTLIEIEPDGVRGCSGLTELKLPESLRIIGISSIQACKKLKSIEIPYGVTEIPFGTFWDCWALERVTLPNTVASIGHYAFAACDNLSEINFPEGLQSIGGMVFALCAKLKSVTLPRSLESIHSKAFTDSGVTMIYGYSGSLAETHANKRGYTFIPLDTPPVLPTVAKYKSQVRFLTVDGVLQDVFEYRLISVIPDADWDAFFVGADGTLRITAVGFVAANADRLPTLSEAQAAVENGTAMPTGWRTASTDYIQKVSDTTDAYFGCRIRGIRHSAQTQDIVCSAYAAYTDADGNLAFVWYEVPVTAAVSTGYDNAVAAYLQLNPDTVLPYA